MEEIDDLISREAYMYKYKYKTFSFFEKLLKQVYKDIIDSTKSIDKVKTSHLKTIYNQISLTLYKTYGETKEKSIEDIKEHCLLFLKTEEKLLDRTFNHSLIDEIFNPDNDLDLIEGYTFNSLFDALTQNNIKSLRNIIAKNIILGENISQATLTEAMNHTYNLSVKQMRTAIRTYTKLMREKILDTTEKQIEGLTGWLSLATLDSKTTPICIKLDKEFYDIKKYTERSEIPNRPPRHFNCRSILLRTTKNNKSFDRTSRGDNGGQEEDSSTTFNSFLNRNPETAKDLLGEKKYDIFKSGKYNIKDFISEDGRFFTIEELKRKFKI